MGCESLLENFPTDYAQLTLLANCFSCRFVDHFYSWPCGVDLMLNQPLRRADYGPAMAPYAASPTTIQRGLRN